MIVGRGDIATALQEAPGCFQNAPERLFFASGVSNSLETRESEYQREKDLLATMPRDIPIVYFSSLAIFYSKTRYTQHKLEMEALIKEFPAYCIIRLGNITFGRNPHTLINHFRTQYQSGKPLEIQNVYRYIVDKDEFLHWVSLIPDFNCEINAPGRRMKVKDVVKEYVL